MQRWTITVTDDGQFFRATIRNDETGADLTLPDQEYDASTSWERDDAIAELFCGRKPNIRDSFDTV